MIFCTCLLSLTKLANSRAGIEIYNPVYFGLDIYQKIFYTEISVIFTPHTAEGTSSLFQFKHGEAFSPFN